MLKGLYGLIGLPGLGLSKIGGSFDSIPGENHDFLMDYFSSDGGSSPWYPNATQHNALYDETVNKTFIAYEGYLEPSGRRFSYVRAYDHTAKTWGRPYVVGPESEITNDDHGVPSLELNADGRLVVVWGNHDGPFHCAISKNAHDNSSWVQGSDLGGNYTYPHQILLDDGTMVVMFRKNIIPGTTYSNGAKILVYVPLTFSGTTITAGSEVTIGDLGDDSRWYAGKQYRLSNGRFAQVATRANYGDTYRRNIYYYEIDIPNEQFVTLDDSVIPFPITQTAMDLIAKIYTTSDNNTSNIPGFAIDGDGRRHVIFNDGGSTDAGGASEAPQDMLHMVSNGTSWGPATIIGTSTQRYNSGAIVPLIDGSVDVYWSKDLHDGTEQRGGAIIKRHLGARKSSSEFDPEIVLVDQDLVNGKPLDQTTNVENASSDIRLLFSERQSTPDDGPETGTLKLYAYGDSGFIKNTKPALVTPQPLTNDGFWLDLSDNSRLFTDSGVTKANVGDRIAQVTDRFNNYTLTTTKGPDLTIISGQLGLAFGGAFSASQFLAAPSKAWGSGGFLWTAMFRHWAPNSTSEHVIAMDGGSGTPRMAVLKTTGNTVGATVFNSSGTGADLSPTAGSCPMGQDYIVQLYTIGTTAYLDINGVNAQSSSLSGSLTTQSAILRIGANGHSTAGNFWQGVLFGAVVRQGEQTSDMRQSDYEWALSQLPL